MSKSERIKKRLKLIQVIDWGVSDVENTMKRYGMEMIQIEWE